MHIVFKSMVMFQIMHDILQMTRIRHHVSTWKRGHNGRRLASVLKLFFVVGNCYIFIQIALKFLAKGPMNNTSVLVLVMSWFTATYIRYAASMN